MKRQCRTSFPIPKSIRTVHVMGIAGTAMAALAGMLHDAGYTVTGSDTAIYPPMSDYLAGLEIPVMKGYVASNLDRQPDLVVVGNVIRADYEEAKALLERDLPYCSFPEAFGALFLRDAHSVVIAGTHGKTTTTAITAWLLEAAGLEPGVPHRRHREELRPDGAPRRRQAASSSRATSTTRRSSTRGRSSCTTARRRSWSRRSSSTTPTSTRISTR